MIHAMSEHHFKAGQTVRIAVFGRFRDLASGDAVKIVRQMPTDGSNLRYRVKDLRRGTERIVEEHDLKAADG